MKRKAFTSILILLSIYSMTFAQKHKGSGIQWHSPEDVDELLKKEKRPLLIDIYTDWCTWCRHMNKTTFSQASIINYINSNFYAVKFNAETLDTVKFRGKTYINRRVGRRPTNDLAIKLLDNKLSYPSLVYFDINGNKTVVPGYKEPKDLEYFLVYFAENVGRNSSLDNFVINYMYSFPFAFKKDHSIFKIDKSLKPDTLGVVNWVEADKVMEMSKKKKKPIFLYYYTDWCISCKVMNKTSFGNSELAKLLNENYYPVRVNAADTSDINFLDKSYKSRGTSKPSELASAFLDNFQMPAVVIFDADHKLVTRVSGYLLSQQLLPLTTYCYKKIYTEMSFQEYMKTYK